ncbi:MAG: transketolase, partial [Aldersonia sp.]|nr:transketolase [Aldersonia sp.]
RQDIPVLEGTNADGVARGGYILAEASKPLPDVVLIGTGSELQLAVAARETLEAQGVAARVVSMPCVEWFFSQDQNYQDQVLPPTVKARVSVEAGIAMPWHKIVGGFGEIVSLEHFGESADYKTLFREYGFTPEAVVAAAQRSLANVKG